MTNELQRSVARLARPHHGPFAHHAFLQETDAVAAALVVMEDSHNAGQFDPRDLGRIVQNVKTAIDIIESHVSTCRYAGRVARKLTASICAIRAVEENLTIRLRSYQQVDHQQRQGK